MIISFRWYALEIVHSFVSIVGEDNVDTSNMGRLTYSYDATPNFQAMPDAVIAPRNTNEVAEVLKVCNTHKIPVYVRGSGTNLCAGTCPLEGGIVLIFRHMNNILEIDEENLTITVQAGVITLDIIKAVEEKGLFYPPDPSSMKISTIGGNINENSGGLRGLKYGVTRDYVMGLELVLPNGDIIRTGGKLAKDVAGYDLTRLFIGSEGTLGVVTEAILKLVPMPETKKTMLALYEDINEAARAVSSFAMRTSTAFIERQTLAIFSISRLTTSGGPSCSINKIAFTSVGKPICANSSTTSIVGWSKNSSVAGMMFALQKTKQKQMRFVPLAVVLYQRS
ncbi:FAD-binding oxidoreductase, partial [Bacillus sp. HC-TM]